jgi:DNA-binding CsgD family transcriptional regulator
VLLGDRSGVAHLIESARTDIAASVEARVLIAGVEVLILPGGETRNDHLRALWRISTSTGNLDSFVCLYRAAPRLLLDLKQIVGEADELLRLVHRANDLELARFAGLGPEAKKLTPREQEVAELLRQGHSNFEIAAGLYISQATVKVHLRHIYEKLGVTNRAGAVARLH